METGSDIGSAGERVDAIEVGEAAAGQRIDAYLARHLDLPRNQIQQWIRDRRVRVDGEPIKPSRPVAAGETVSWQAPEPSAAIELVPEAGDLAVIYLDADIVVVNKPADLTVHPGAGRSTGTLVHRLLDRFPEIARTGGRNRPGIVHRIDKDTTGVLVVARNEKSYRALSAAFSERRVEKTYLTIVYGVPKSDRGSIEQPIGRHPHKRKEMAVRPDGRPARTSYRVVESVAGLALLEVGLETGRTHQIRVHMKAIHHPIVGDPIYGEARWKTLPGRSKGPVREFSRPALHASMLRFAHPATGEEVTFIAPPAADFAELWCRIGGCDIVPRRQDTGSTD